MVVAHYVQIKSSCESVLLADLQKKIMNSNSLLLSLIYNLSYLFSRVTNLYDFLVGTRLLDALTV